MPALSQRKLHTSAEYLALEEKAETRSEYWNGEIVAMIGSNINHQQIAANISRILGNKLYGRRRVFSSEMKVWVKKRDKFFYPDLTVICRQPEFYKKDATRLLIRIGLESLITFQSIEPALSLSEIYDLVEFEEENL